MYSGVVDRVGDASLMSGVCNSLLTASRKAYTLEILANQQNLRDHFYQKQALSKSEKLLSLSDAKKRKHKYVQTFPKQPPFVGGKIIDVAFDEFEHLIPWHIFFKTWGMKLSSLNDVNATEQQKEFFEDIAKALMQLKIVASAKVSVKIFKANSEDGSVILYNEDNTVADTLWFVRNQSEDLNGECVSIADYVGDKTSSTDDFVGLYVATIGREVDEYIDELKSKGDDYQAMLVRCLSDCSAEALSEYVRTQIFKMKHSKGCQCPSCSPEQSKNNGICVACGYSSFPDHSQKSKFEKLLQTRDIGVEFTSSYMMRPTSSVASIWISNPDAKYIDPIVSSEQIADIANRSSRSVADIQKYMSIKIID